MFHIDEYLPQHITQIGTGFGQHSMDIQCVLLANNTTVFICFMYVAVAQGRYKPQILITYLYVYAVYKTVHVAMIWNQNGLRIILT